MSYYLPLAVFAVIGSVLGLTVAIFQEWLKRREVRRAQKELAVTKDAHQHVWRTVLKPYVRQCRRCNAFEFREDANGDFPDHMREWLEAYNRGTPVPWTPDPVLHVPAVYERSTGRCVHDVNFSDHCDTCAGTKSKPRPDLCHCGASMVYLASGKERTDDPDVILSHIDEPVWFCEVCESWRKITV